MNILLVVDVFTKYCTKKGINRRKIEANRIYFVVEQQKHEVRIKFENLPFKRFSILLIVI